MPSRQACDSCRKRKTKCRMISPPPGDEALNRSPWRNQQSDACKACQFGGVKCTYNIPVKKRGPPRKIRLEMMQSSSDQDNTLAHLRQLSRPSSQHSEESISPRVREFQYLDDNNGNTCTPPVEASNSTPRSASCGEFRYPIQFPEPSVSRNPQDHLNSTNQICCRKIFDSWMQDYLDRLYPIMPVVHRPTFIRDLEEGREETDPEFMAFLAATCAIVIAMMPSRFYMHRESIPPLPFHHRNEMVDHCYEICLRLRTAAYYDQNSHTKWAIAYLFAIAYLQLGRRRRVSMLFAEYNAQARLLDFHRKSAYNGLNPIQTQLLKKAFWLTLYSHIHHMLEPLDNKMILLYDDATIKAINPEELMPVEVDDEYIFEDGVLSQPPRCLSLTYGLNALSRIFWIAFMDNEVLASSDVTCSSNSTPSAAARDLTLWKARLHKLKYSVDELDPSYSQWNNAEDDLTTKVSREEESSLRHVESMRANIHVTHLWLQSVLNEKIENLIATISGAAGSHEMRWNEKEDICRQLLHILYNVSSPNLEPNGNNLTHKIRSFAATLLDCPFEEQGPIGRRAKNYIQKFTNLLSQLDNSMDAALFSQNLDELDKYSRKHTHHFDHSLTASSMGHSSTNGALSEPTATRPLLDGLP